MIFKKKKPQNSDPLELDHIPDGTAIEAKGIYFFVKGGLKYRIPSSAILLSQNYPRVLKVTARTANKIKNSSSKIGFREGTLVKDFSDNKYYLISGNKRRHITSPEVLSQLGGTPAILVSHQDILLHEEGEALDKL